MVVEAKAYNELSLFWLPVIQNYTERTWYNKLTRQNYSTGFCFLTFSSFYTRSNNSTQFLFFYGCSNPSTTGLQAVADPPGEWGGRIGEIFVHPQDFQAGQQKQESQEKHLLLNKLHFNVPKVSSPEISLSASIVTAWMNGNIVTMCSRGNRALPKLGIGDAPHTHMGKCMNGASLLHLVVFLNVPWGARIILTQSSCTCVSAGKGKRHEAGFGAGCLSYIRGKIPYVSL